MVLWKSALKVFSTHFRPVNGQITDYANSSNPARFLLKVGLFGSATSSWILAVDEIMVWVSTRRVSTFLYDVGVPSSQSRHDIDETNVIQVLQVERSSSL